MEAASKCKFMDGEQADLSSKSMQYNSKWILSAGQSTTECTKMLTERVLKKMAHDAISVVMESDGTILKVGEQLLEKRGTEKASEVSQKM